jgi:hypothetical protein
MSCSEHPYLYDSLTKNDKKSAFEKALLQNLYTLNFFVRNLYCYDLINKCSLTAARISSISKGFAK